MKYLPGLDETDHGSQDEASEARYWTKPQVGNFIEEREMGKFTGIHHRGRGHISLQPFRWTLVNGSILFRSPSLVVCPMKLGQSLAKPHPKN